MSVSVWHRGSKPCLGTCTFSSLLIGASNLRWNRRSAKSASNRCCKTSGGNKLPSGAVRLCGIASVNFHLKVSTLENQNTAKEKNNTGTEEMEKRKKSIVDFVVCRFFIELPFFPSLALFNMQKFNLFKSKDIIQFEKE